MRVRILSGNAAGGEQDVPDVDGQAMLDTGYAERVVVRDEAPAPVAEPPSIPLDVGNTSSRRQRTRGGK